MEIYKSRIKNGLFWISILALLCAMIIGAATVAEKMNPVVETDDENEFDERIETIEGENTTCYVIQEEGFSDMSCIPNNG